MAGFRVDDFRSRGLNDDGARPNLFEVSMFFPALPGVSVDAQQFTFLCKAAQIPGSNMGVIEVPYFGRQVKVAGNRTYDDWTVTIISDESYRIRRAFEAWHAGINGPQSNLRSPNAINSSGYTKDAVVTHFKKNGGTLASYRMIGAFPSNVAPIDLDWGSNDTLEEFTVTFAYQYWLSDKDNPNIIDDSTKGAAGTNPSTPDIKVASPVAQGATADVVDGFTAAASFGS
jgi:hypothetical protein